MLGFYFQELKWFKRTDSKGNFANNNLFHSVSRWIYHGQYEQWTFIWKESTYCRKGAKARQMPEQYESLAKITVWNPQNFIA